VRVLEVGMGGWGRYWAMRMLPQVPGMELVGCVDVDPRALELAAEQVGIASDRCFTSLEEGLAATGAEAVLVATSLEGHVPAVRTALRAGRHVLVEKPFAPSLAEARELVALARERGRVLMVSQNYRFYPAVQAVLRLVRSGTLGAPHLVEIDFRHHSTVPEGEGRRGHRLLAQPLLMDMSIHHFDLLRLLLARDADWVSCHAWNPHWSGFDGPVAAVAAIGFGDVMVGYRGSWVTWGENTPWAGEWRMTFERGEIRWTSRGMAGDRDAERVVVRPRDGHGEEYEPDLPEVPLIDQAGSLAEFAAAIAGGREPRSSGRENLGSLALALAAVESSQREGERVAVPAQG
jgi:predicted dehydrogenase